MFDKLDFILEKYEELSLKVSDPDIINNQPLWQKHIKEMGEMEPIVNKYREYKKAKEGIAEAKEMLEMGDDELQNWKIRFWLWKTNLRFFFFLRTLTMKRT